MSFYTQKITNFQCEWCHVLFFTFSVILQECHCVIDGENIDINKVEVIVGMQHFFSSSQKNNIAIWFYMLLENDMEVFSMFMPQVFVDQFFFIWGCDQCSIMSNQLKVETYYYLKDFGVQA
jgi:hypothetical protein